MSVLYVTMFILSCFACVWSTVFAYISYKCERDKEYMTFVRSLVFRDLLPQFVQPLLSRKLIRSVSTTRRGADAGDESCTAYVILYLQLCKTQILTLDEYNLFVSLCMEVLTRRRSCYTQRQIRRKVEDVCATYIWARASSSIPSSPPLSLSLSISLSLSHGRQGRDANSELIDEMIDHWVGQ